MTGYLFQKMFAYYYGASVEKSIFDIAFSVPTMLIYLSGFGMTHAIVVSLFTRLRIAAQTDLDRVFSSLLNASLLLLLAFMLATALFSLPVSHWLAPGLRESDQTATQRLILWMLPLALVFGISSYLSAVATAWRIPIAQEILLLTARVVVIAFVTFKGRALPLPSIAVVLVIVTAVGLAAQWCMVARITGLRYYLELDLRDPRVRGAVHQIGGFAVVALTAQVASAYWRRMGTIAGPEVVALLGFGFSLIDSLGSIVAKIAAFQFGQPLAANIAIQGSSHDSRALRRTLLRVALPASALAVMVAIAAHPIVRLLFAGGAFDAVAVLQTAAYLRVMAIALPGTIVLSVVLYPLLATGRHEAAVTYTLGYLMQVGLIQILFQRFHGMAIPLGYSACVWFQALLGLALLSVKMSVRRGLIP